MQMDARMLFEPGVHFRMLIGGVVVDDDVQVGRFVRLLLGFLQQEQKLIVAVRLAQEHCWWPQIALHRVKAKRHVGLLRLRGLQHLTYSQS